MAEVAHTWRVLNFEQRVTAVGAVLLAISTFGPFSFVEAAQLLVAAGLLALLHARAQGKRFHLPFGDGTVILTAGIWAALLITARLLGRPLGQNLLALVCAGILVVAGAAERAKHPADDIPAGSAPAGGGGPPGGEAHEPEAGGGRAELEHGGEEDGLGRAQAGDDGFSQGSAGGERADLEHGRRGEDLA